MGHPPKIVWLRVGNCSTKAIATLLRARAVEIERFIADEQESILVVSPE
jgi:predicted nuclease of predicted toxin-antitoxin system